MEAVLVGRASPRAAASAWNDEHGSRGRLPHQPRLMTTGGQEEPLVQISGSHPLFFFGSSSARQKYQAAVERCGRQRSPNSNNSFGRGNSFQPYVRAKPLRTP